MRPKMKKMNLFELEDNFQTVDKQEQAFYMGRWGTGNPFTAQQFDSMLANGTWAGGFVQGMGFVAPEFVFYGSSSYSCNSYSGSMYGYSNNNNLWQNTFENFNNFAKNISFVPGAVIELAQFFSQSDIAWLRRLGRISDTAGWVIVGIDGALLADAVRNDQPWGQHATNVGTGLVSQIPIVGTPLSFGIDAVANATRGLASKLTDWYMEIRRAIAEAERNGNM